MLYKRALEAYERVLSKEHPETLASVSGLAYLYGAQDRYDEAEPLLRRILETYELALGKEHPETLTIVNYLALMFSGQGRYGEAEPLHERALEAQERVLGKAHPDTLLSVNNLALMYHNEGRYGEAELLYRRAVEAYERVLGKEHLQTLISLNNLALLYDDQGRYDEAELLHRRAVEAYEHSLGKEHPLTLGSLASLAAFHYNQGDWLRAATFWRQSTAALAKRSLRSGRAVGEALVGKKKSDTAKLHWQFWALVKAVNRLAEDGREANAEALREMFRTAQSALNSEAAQSLAQMAARGDKGDPELAILARERQDLVAEWQNRDALRNAWLGQALHKRNAEAGENTARLAAIDVRVAAIDKRLTAEFPDYAALVSPEPLSVEAVQALLGEDEALVLFLVTPKTKQTPEENFIWVVSKTDVRWVRSHLGDEALIRDMRALRCGLDEEEWTTQTNASVCANLLGLTALPDAARPLPFDLSKAHALYQALFGKIEDIITGKRLLIVPSGALTSLPFHVLVTEMPGIALPEKFEGYRDVAWLGKNNAIATLPAVSSLKALRQHALNREAAPHAYAGYGNPVLSGDGASCQLPKVPDRCPVIEVAEQRAPPTAMKQTGSSGGERAIIRGRGGRRTSNANTDKIFAHGATQDALLEQVRGLCPLPDTAYEIKCVAERFNGKAPLIRLEGDAKETHIKSLSQSGQLARYRVLHFATHGLLSGDVERMAKRQGEPALVLTPPDKPVDADDDGLLMASEVAALKLNADWVVMSACNTAAGDQFGAQALSGLARAFFYAGGRALLVSHWPVYSDAAVRLTTSTFAELDRNPKAGRAEALRNAMIALMDDRFQPDNAHPAVWAPFVVVGEGGR